MDRAELATRINTNHKIASKGVEAAIECGNDLREAQRRCQEAGYLWLGWVDANLDFGESQAQKYMLIARNPATARGSTINTALKFSGPAQHPRSRGAKPARI
jgi:hypothetical protein